MNDFPMTREQWYAQRDDRTRKTEGIAGFEAFSVAVIVDEHVSLSYDIQVMTITALNILSRWCRIIRVQIPPDSVSILPLTHGKNLQTVIEGIVKSSDPFNDLSFGSVIESDFDRVLLIGTPSTRLNKPQVLISSTGWYSGIGVGQIPMKVGPISESNPLGPSFAACLGVAELFRSACGLATSGVFNQWYSLLDFTQSHEYPQTLETQHEFPRSLDLGRIYQIGCGAVGSCLDFFLSLTSWRGIINLIDYDQVAIDNCNRSLCFSAYDAIKEAKKTEVCSRVLAGTSISVEPFDGDYSQFISQAKYLMIPPDLILCLANERNIWEVVQHNFPPLVLHATTSPNWGLNFGRHIPRREWCILCRFSVESPHQFTPVCAEGVIPVPGPRTQSVLGVLPFLSPAAAVLTLSELVKISFEVYPSNPDFVQFSMRSASSNFLTMQRNPTDRCVCQHQRLTHYPDEIKSTKYWHISELPGTH